MTNKIIAWTWLIITIIATLGWLTMTNENYWLFTFIYMIGSIYLFTKYIESLRK